MVKGIFCLSDDEFLIDKARDGITFDWLNQLKRLVKLDASDVILYNEVAEVLRNQLAELSDKNRIAAELGCKPDEIEQVVKDSLQNLKKSAPSDNEINEVRKTVFERLMKAIGDGDLPKSALDNLEKIKTIEIVIADKASTRVAYATDHFIVLPIKEKLSRAELSHEMIHVISSFVENAVFDTLLKSLDMVDGLNLQEYQVFLYNEGEKICNILSEYTCEALLNWRFFPDYIKEDICKTESYTFTKKEMLFCEECATFFDKQTLVELFFGNEASVDPKLFIGWIIAKAKS